MPETLLPIQAQTIPAGLCYSNLTTDIPIIASYLRAIFSGNEWNTGSSTPAPSDREKPWNRTNSDGTPDGTWNYANGYWLQQHPLPVGLVAMFEGAEVDIETYDGGEAGAISSITGAFWEKVDEMDARSPIGPGTLSPSGTIINIGSDLGEEAHVQTLGEMVGHTHDIPFSSQGGLSGDGGHILNGTPVRTNEHSTGTTGSTPPTAMNVIHPVHAIWFIRRTARLYRRRNG